MSPGGIADHAIDAHGRGGLNDDDAVENQVVKLQRAPKPGNRQVTICGDVHAWEVLSCFCVA